MELFPVDRKHPPSRIVYRDAERYLELRPWAVSDVDAILAAVNASLPELKRFMPWAHLPVTRAQEYRLLADFFASYHAGDEYILGVFSERGEVLGGTGMHPRVPLNPSALEVGYWCNSANAGRGVITLAVQMQIAFAFDRFGCDRFQVMHDEANVASRRVSEKCGFVFEGVMRNATAQVAPEVRAGGYEGTGRHRLYAITRDDLPGLPWLEGIRAGLSVYNALGELA